MTNTEAAEILRTYNRWRRGAPPEVRMPEVGEIGDAIDVAIAALTGKQSRSKAVAKPCVQASGIKIVALSDNVHQSPFSAKRKAKRGEK